MSQFLFLRALAVERYGMSRILRLLPREDLLSCAGASRHLRHLAFTILYRDFTFVIHLPLEPIQDAGDAGETGDAMARSRRSSPTVVPNSAVEREVTSLDDVAVFLRRHAHILTYIKSLDLRVPPSKSEDVAVGPSRFSDASTFIAILHLAPRLENLWLTDILLTGTATYTGTLIAEQHWSLLTLRHVCLQLSYRWRAPGVPPPDLLRNLLMPFGTIADLRIRCWRAPMDVLDPLPQHLRLHALTLDDRVSMHPLFAQLARHPLVRLLRRLDFQDEVPGSPEEVCGALYELLDAAGAQLEHFAFGALTLQRAFLGGDKWKNEYRKALADRVCARFDPARLASLALHVLLWGEEYDHYYTSDRMHNIWTDAIDVLECMRTSSPAAVAGVRTITVKINAWAVHDAAALKARIVRHKYVRDRLETELLRWRKELGLQRVVVEFLDSSDLALGEERWAVLHGPQLMFPRLRKKGLLHHQDLQILEERWIHRSDE
ncbi:hypothetical protein PsYK624_151140 [Phanerochaete sordida]|uniref:F-box domain-containing protein n=1 Tax=Phanerochaete sordida TaxID=48140 RepID=A0A9P3LM12_9APHY|nr:hypothetical protein PsYK624_151140 [Phanerochaete sordida]